MPEVPAEGPVAEDLHARLADVVDFAVERLARQPVFGDSDRHHPSRHGQGLEDGYRVPGLGQAQGGREARGPDPITATFRCGPFAAWRGTTGRPLRDRP